MTRITYIQNLHDELKKLNYRIDSKILRGQSYTAEARRHKMLVAEIKKLKTRMNPIARMVATFMF